MVAHAFAPLKPFANPHIHPPRALARSTCACACAGEKPYASLAARGRGGGGHGGAGTGTGMDMTSGGPPLMSSFEVLRRVVDGEWPPIPSVAVVEEQTHISSSSAANLNLNANATATATARGGGGAHAVHAVHAANGADMAKAPWPREIANIIRRCWAAQPSDRTTFDELVRYFESDADNGHAAVAARRRPSAHVGGARPAGRSRARDRRSQRRVRVDA